MDRRLKVLSASAIIIAVLVVGLWGVDFQNTVTVTDLADEHIGKRVTVAGEIKPETLRSLDNGSTILFTLMEGDYEVDIVYAEPQPVNLMEGQSATVSGTVLPDRTISAYKLVTACPSKYSSPNTTLEPQHNT